MSQLMRDFGAFDDGYLGYDPRLSSLRFDDSFSSFADSDDSPKFTSDPISPQSVHALHPYQCVPSLSLPPPSEMQGSALREWSRLNTIRLEERQKREKEVLRQIVDEADDFKIEFYRKREVTVEINEATNREKEKLYVASHEKFHAEAANNYWQSIGDLIPNEVPTIEKKKGKKPSFVAIHGPKPGKPTDLSRMRRILLKLKHNTPPHLKHSPPTGPSTKADSATAPAAPAVTTSPEPVAVA